MNHKNFIYINGDNLNSFLLIKNIKVVGVEKIKGEDNKTHYYFTTIDINDKKLSSEIDRKTYEKLIKKLIKLSLIEVSLID